MKSGFHDPIAVKEGKKVKSPWNFDCPDYDERTSCYVNTGSHYGVGHRQPVGKKGNPLNNVPCLPKTNSNTMYTDEIPHKNLTLEIEE
jgi:hypothetical protein